MIARVAVLGAGAWGTALAVHLAGRGDIDVQLWARDAQHASAMRTMRENSRYLPGTALPASVAISSDLRDLAGTGLLIVATPIAALGGIVATLRGESRATFRD